MCAASGAVLEDTAPREPEIRPYDRVITRTPGRTTASSPCTGSARSCARIRHHDGVRPGAGRSDGRLGSDVEPSQSDCSQADEIGAEQGAALARGDVSSFVGKPRPCSVSTDPSGGPLNLLMRGDGQEMKSLVEVLVHRPYGARQDRIDRPLRLRHEAGSADGAGMPQKAGANIPAAAANIPQADGSSLMTTLHEQLGLKLESTRDGVTVVVVDSVEAASAD
jgi:hypothetical protein